MTGRYGIDGQDRDASADLNDGNAHLRRELLAVKCPAELNRHVALEDRALNGNRLARGLRLLVKAER